MQSSQTMDFQLERMLAPTTTWMPSSVLSPAGYLVKSHSHTTFDANGTTGHREKPSKCTSWKPQLAEAKHSDDFHLTKTGSDGRDQCFFQKPYLQAVWPRPRKLLWSPGSQNCRKFCWPLCPAYNFKTYGNIKTTLLSMTYSLVSKDVPFGSWPWTSDVGILPRMMASVMKATQLKIMLSLFAGSPRL